MARGLFVICAVVLAAGTLAAQKAPPPPKGPPAADRKTEPEEEDQSLKNKEYAFNPLQAEKEVRVGNFYFKKGSYKAAASRFSEATKWNPGLAEAWLRLGDAWEKLNDQKAAREAFSKYIGLAPEDKRAPEIRKKLEAKK